MKKIKPVRPSLGHRIANAVKALKGEPWPAQIVFNPPPPVKYNPARVETFAARRTYFFPGSGHITREEFLERQRHLLAREIGKTLLSFGAIEFCEEGNETAMQARIRVVMPEKKED